MFAMKFVAIAALVALASASPVDVLDRLPEEYHSAPHHVEEHHHNDDKILHQTREGPNADGSYAYSFETSNGIKRQESGKQVEDHNSKWGVANSVDGSFSYVGNDGKEYGMKYIADQHGFRTVSNHLGSPAGPAVAGWNSRANQGVEHHEVPRHEEPRHEEPRHEEPRHEEPRHEEPHHEVEVRLVEERHEAPHYEQPRHEVVRHQAPRHYVAPVRHEAPRHYVAPIRHEVPRHEAPRHDDDHHDNSWANQH